GCSRSPTRCAGCAAPRSCSAGSCSSRCEPPCEAAGCGPVLSSCASEDLPVQEVEPAVGVLGPGEELRGDLLPLGGVGPALPGELLREGSGGDAARHGPGP